MVDPVYSFNTTTTRIVLRWPADLPQLSMSSAKIEEKEELLLQLSEIKTVIAMIESQVDALAGHFEKAAAATSLATNVMSIWTTASEISSTSGPRQFSVHSSKNSV